MVAWLSVVADQAHPSGSQKRAAERDQMISDRRWRPGVDAVRHNVVEPAGLSPGIAQIDCLVREIGEAERIHSLLPLGNRPLGGIDPDKFRMRQRVSERDQVAPITTS